jgi:hypothetical protein
VVLLLLFIVVNVLVIVGDIDNSNVIVVVVVREMYLKSLQCVFLIVNVCNSMFLVYL